MFLFALLVCAMSFFFSTTQVVFASQVKVDSPSKTTIVEHLRLRVPKKDREAWLLAEKRSWEPWLENQDGFLGRQLLWDKDNEEATLLISWSSKKLWKSIPKEEIDQVQELFEKLAREATGKNTGNPFPIKYEGALSPQ